MTLWPDSPLFSLPPVCPGGAGVLLFSGVGQQPAPPAVCLLFGAVQPLVIAALLQDQRPAGQRRGADTAGLHIRAGGERRLGWLRRRLMSFFYRA